MIGQVLCFRAESKCGMLVGDGWSEGEDALVPRACLVDGHGCPGAPQIVAASTLGRILSQMGI